MRTMISGMTAAAVVATVMAGGLVGADECPIAKQQRLAREAAAGHVQTVAFKAAEADIVDTAVAAGDFTTLVAAVKAAGLVETLKSEGPFTVFAPTDAAFAKLPEGTVETLLKPENKEKLVGILTYHVVPGKVMAADVVKLSEAKTVQGKAAKITVDGGTVKVDDATVVKADMPCPTGDIPVIHAFIRPA